MRQRLWMLTVAFLLVALIPGCVVIPIGFPSMPTVKQVTYREGKGWAPKKIAIIDVSGVITGGGEGQGFFPVDSSVVDLDKKLAAVREDKSVKAVILRVDSPGGGVTASDIMFRQISRFREETEIPVYVSMQTLAASGGYYVSMAADQVYATPTTITGSIGVIGTFPEFRGLMDKIGVDFNAITSGKNKDAGAFYREMTDEDRALYQALIDDMYEQFLSVVGGNRTDLDAETLRELADGRVYTAHQAMDVGLIDGIAYLDEVIETIETDLGIDEPTVVLVKRTGSQSVDTLYAQTGRMVQPGASTQINLLNVDMGGWSTPTNEVFNYMWIP